MNVNDIAFVGLKYEPGYLDPGNYKIYHSSIATENLMEDQIFSNVDLEAGLQFKRVNFPSSLIQILESDTPYSFILEKV